MSYRSYYGNALPLEILENAIKIARNPNDKARAHYYLATRLRPSGEWHQKQRVPDELEAALKSGKTSDWYDDALYFYAEWMATVGRITQTETGEWQQQADFLKALQLFRRLTSEFKKGESRYYDQAVSQIERITKPYLAIHATNVFLPGSEIQVNFSWRNVNRVELRLYRVDLPQDIRFTDKDQNSHTWTQKISVAGRTPLKSWSKETREESRHAPGQELMRLEQPLPAGAYLIEAQSGGVSAREVILVSDASLLLKTSGRQALVYFCNALDGAPLEGANVRLWEKTYNNSKQEWLWRETESLTNRDGIATFALNTGANHSEIFVSARRNDQQAFSLGSRNSHRSDTQPWRIYAFTDRPVYRPREVVQWKFIARKIEASVYSTPANQLIEYEIHDPQGNKIKEDKVTLNTFGSAWGGLELTEAMPLGAYRVTFYTPGRTHNIGSAGLFRLEEYKLPEFKVTVQTPEIDGRKKAFRLGEKVEVTIGADYYFGGAVSDANVEVVVYQNAFRHYWQPQRDYPWYYTDITPHRDYYGGGRGQILKREVLKTNAEGKATLVFETPRAGGQDWQYFIEARVTEASRREIIGSNTVRVTRQRYYVYPRAEHNLYRPNDKVEINIKSLDANGDPVAVAGQVKVTRNYYYEIWLDPLGREVTGAELDRIRTSLRARGDQFPPAPDKQGRSWRLKFRGYQQDDILTQELRTNSDGEAVLSFTAPREGYYRAAWVSPDPGGPMVQAETAVWVTTNRTTELGYRYGGVEIIVDKDTLTPGQRAPVMLNALAPNRYVLFSVEGDDLFSYRLVHLTGTSKLIDIAVEETHVPNIFLTAALISDRQLFVDTKQVIVPPIDHFLNVEVKSDREEYKPQEEGMVTVRTRDRHGKPVAAEVALGLIDASVYYIQEDTSGDPRQFYFGTKRALRSQVFSTFQQKAYAKLVVGPDKNLIDERVFERDMKKESSAGPYERRQTLAELSPSGTMRSSSEGDGDLRLEGAESIQEFGTAGRATALGRMPAGAAPPTDEPAVQVRSDFRSTVFWQPDVVTDADGIASIKVKYPDSLTSWTAHARVNTAGDKFGIASSETRTKKPLIVRLQAPRFFVAGDTVTVSAVINNNNNQPMTVMPSLDAAGVVSNGLMHHGQRETRGPVIVPPNGEERVDWVVNVAKPGAVKLKVTARGETETDAMERQFTAYEHGIEKFVARSGKVRGDDVILRLDIPKERKPESTSLMVQVSPSMAVTMLDALPYLIDYPYGCTEQTMSRFLPAAITAKTLKDLGLLPEDAMGKVFGSIEAATAKQMQPKGKRDLSELDRIVKAGLERIYSMQNSSGGWGWWKDDPPDHFMTAYVLWGLSLAHDAGIPVKQDVISRAADFLNKEIVEAETSYDLQAWLLHAAAAHHAAIKKGQSPTSEQKRAVENLWANREKLNAYTRALLALSVHNFGDTEKAQTLVRNLENGVKLDRTPDTSIIQRGNRQSLESVMATAHWGEDGIYYRWSDGGVEATSFVLRALLAIDPQNKLIEPVTNWLIKNRRGAQWSNTRDTAITILALNDFLRVSGEATPSLEYELLVNGSSIIKKRVTTADVFSAPSQFQIDREFIRDGVNEVRIRRVSGDGALYFGAQAQFFSLEEPVKAAGNEIFVRREYFRLVGHPTLLKGHVYERVPLREGEAVTSGDRVEVVVTIEAKNNYEYLLFEDLKPAGLEAVQLRSGEPLSARELKSGAAERKFVQSAHAQTRRVMSPVTASSYTGRTSYVYQELRDRKVALFIGKLPQGIWEIRYSLRAEVPGSFHALPVIGHAMYVPEIRCNDEEIRIRVGSAL
ncbi:MAG TPA: alpha-2-macroglobulin family protein [Pyrinomonadaceae bacterium]|nr:alpha-2-macroglobulin family protein [Pyrinomonadaceae bacterium]